MWIERPGKIFFAAMEGDHVHLSLPFHFPFENEIQFDVEFNAIQWYTFLKKSYSSKYSLNAPQHSSSPEDKECWQKI